MSCVLITSSVVEIPATGHYTRLFLPTQEPFLLGDQAEEGYLKLGCAMMDDGTATDVNYPPPPAGYTYLGQFIDHDLTLDITPLPDAGAVPPEQTTNFRSARLDLDNLYGGGPFLMPFLYRRDWRPASARFAIGCTSANSYRGKDYSSSGDDLPRNLQGIALTADPRQDENLNLAQLHVAFLKFHNLLMDRPEQFNKLAIYREAGSDFDKVRRVVTWHYQWIVRYDYLQQILDEDVFNHLPDKPTAGNDLADEFGIPVEFSLAAFRFGHSMVRDQYVYNSAHPQASLMDLFLHTAFGGGAVPALPADWVIEWRRFFTKLGDTGLVGHSRKIDTQIAKGLHELPDLEVRSQLRFQALSDPKQLPVRTLQRGGRVRLASGQEVANALRVAEAQRLKASQIATGPDGEIVHNYHFDEATPLWYYILKEAEVFNDGRRLGTIGSRIVADVILGALQNDPDSYLVVDPSWRPTLTPEAKTSFGISDLLRFVLRPD